MNAPFRIEDIQKITYNGCRVKLFKAWRYSPVAGAYIFDGQYSVPQRTSNKNIAKLYADGDVLRTSNI